MYAHLIVMALVTALGAGLLSWIVARRIGTRWALALPVLALAAMIVILARSQGLGFHDALGMTATAAVFALPVLVGAMAGILLHLLTKPKPRQDP